MTPDQSPPRVVAAACDGACSGNPGPGGWGSLLRFEDGSVQEFGAADPATTNNRMELKAALVLLECLKDLPCHPSLTIRTDSRYVIDGFSKWMAGWKRKGWRTASGSPVLNRELWEALDRARLPAVPFTYVKGHSGDPDNDRCDAIAVAFSKGGRPALAQASPQAISSPVQLSARPAAGGQGTRSRARQTVLAVSSKVDAASPAGVAATQPAGEAQAEIRLDPETTNGAGTGPTGGTKAGAKAATGTETKTAAKTGAKAGTTKPTEKTCESGSGATQPLQAANPVEGSEPVQEPAPAALGQLLSRLELADRLAAGGYSLSLVELAQLVQVPMKQLAAKATAWTWRDWTVLPQGEGRWRLERGAAGSESVPPGT